MKGKSSKLSWGWSPSDIKVGNTIVVVEIKAGVCRFLIPAQNFEIRDSIAANVKSVEKFGGHYLLNTSAGEMTLTNAESGLITFVE